MRALKMLAVSLLTALELVLLQGTSAAADVCGESVPATRFIDGIPAYAQCTASQNSAIYSNDGIATSTTSGGAGWLRTQYSGGYQCTELAHRYLAFRFDITSVPNGDAGVWCQATLPAGLVKADVPVHGDLIVLGPGSCGADATTGHVAVVDTVNADKTSLTAVQQNTASRGQYKLTCAACFLHATANTGSSADGGAAVDGGPRDVAVSDGYDDAAVAGKDAGPADGRGAGGEPGGLRDAGLAQTGGAPASPSGDASTAGGPSNHDEGSGCSCEVLGPSGSAPSWLLAAVVGALLLWLRRSRPTG